MCDRTGWSKSWERRDWTAWSKGDWTIYEFADGHCSLSQHQVWLPDLCESWEEALQVIEREGGLDDG